MARSYLSGIGVATLCIGRYDDRGPRLDVAPHRPLMPMPHAAASSRRLAYAALVLTALLWASSAVTARGLLDTLAPAWLTALRWCVVLACLVPFAWRERAAIAHAWRHDLRAL